MTAFTSVLDFCGGGSFGIRKRVLVAETRRLFTSRLFGIFILALIVLDLIVGVGAAINADKAIEGGSTSPNLTFLSFLGTSGVADLLVAFLGITLVTREFTTGSILRNSIYAGGPVSLLAIKMLVSSIAGMLFAVIELAIHLLGAAIWANINGFTLVWNGHLALVVFREFIVVTLAGPYSVLIGWLGKRERPTIWTYAAFSSLVVPLIATFAPIAYEYLPNGASNAVAGVIGVRHVGAVAGTAIYLFWMFLLGATGSIWMNQRGLI